jgi:hypothetical protein
MLQLFLQKDSKIFNLEKKNYTYLGELLIMIINPLIMKEYYIPKFIILLESTIILQD